MNIKRLYKLIRLMMNKYTITALMACVAIWGGCSKINKMFNIEDDSHIEENIERVILKETGVDIDLTPSSPETENVDSTCGYQY